MNRSMWRWRGFIAVCMGLTMGCGSSPLGRDDDGDAGGTSPGDAGTSGGSLDGSETAPDEASGADDQPTGDQPTDGGDGPSDDGSSKFDLGASGGDGNCVPSGAEACNGLDDDCDGSVDDVDAEGDGFCDCLSIALVGATGSLSSSMFEQWIIDRGSSAMRIDPAMVDGPTLAQYDVIILDQLTRSYAEAEIDAFQAWVEAGGGLMAMTGHVASDPVRDRPNGILERFGLRYDPGLVSGPVVDFEPHPLTAGLTSVTFLGGFPVVELGPAGATTVIGSIDGVGPVARAVEVGDGKVFAWGDEWIEYDSEWSQIPEIEVLWRNVFDWIAPVDVCGGPPG